MRSYKLVWFKNTITNQVFATSTFTGETMERLFNGDLVITKVETIEIPEYPSHFELDIVVAHDKGKKIPNWLQPRLERALKKRRELVEYHKRMKTLPREKR